VDCIKEILPLKDRDKRYKYRERKEKGDIETKTSTTIRQRDGLYKSPALTLVRAPLYVHLEAMNVQGG
jgi:hypothetical protein